MAPRRGNIDTIGQTQLRELSGGTFATKLVTTDESSKTTGNILTVDDNGNVVDSGVAATATVTGASLVRLELVTPRGLSRTRDRPQAQRGFSARIQPGQFHRVLAPVLVPSRVLP
jgi:hypothetical protein